MALALQLSQFPHESEPPVAPTNNTRLPETICYEAFLGALQGYRAMPGREGMRWI
jgi:hypothetical protein